MHVLALFTEPLDHCQSFSLMLNHGNPFPVYNTTEDGWIIYNQTQYFINNEKLDMESARDFCKKNFGDLVIITGESERKFLWKKARNSS